MFDSRISKRLFRPPGNTIRFFGTLDVEVTTMATDEFRMVRKSRCVLRPLIPHAIILFIFWLAAHPVSGQIPPSPNLYDEAGQRVGHWTVLLDKNFHETTIKDSAVYYGLINYQIGKPAGKVRYFYRSSRTKLWEGFAVDFNPLPVVTEGETREYFENGQLKEIQTFSGGKRNGPIRRYHQNGKLLMEAYLRDDTPDGKVIYYYESGNKEEEQTYVNGKKNGEYRHYFEDGQLHKISEFKDGKEDGRTEEFYQNGKRNTLYYQKNGERHGPWEWYNTNGIPEQRITYVNGKAIGEWLDFHEDGVTPSLRGLKDSLGQQGLWTSYHPNGVRKEEIRYVNDVRNGPMTGYHPNGNIREAGTIVDGLYQGEWLSYHEDGSLKGKVTYRNDTLHGLIENFYAGSGSLRVRGYRLNGLKEGRWTFYFPDGTVDGVESYQNGVLNGPVFNYYPNGQLKDSTTFRNDVAHGSYRTWFENGKPATIGRNENGNAEGIWKRYYDNGQLKSAYPYLKGIMHGPFQEYHPDGRLKRQGLVKSGNIDGSVSRWYANGNMASTGKMINGVSDGKWIFYDSATGRKNEIRPYQNGRIHGRTVYFDSSGKVSRVDHHINGFPEEIFRIRDSIKALVHAGLLDQARRQLPWLKGVMKRDGLYRSVNKRLIPELQTEIALQEGKYNEAIAHQQDALSIMRNYSDTTYTYHRYLNNLAVLYSKAGQKEEALKLYKIVMRFDSLSLNDDKDGYSYWITAGNHADDLYELNRKEEAYQFIDSRLKAFSRMDSSYRQVIMRGLFAVANFIRVTSNEPDSAISRYERVYRYCGTCSGIQSMLKLKQTSAVRIANLYYNNQRPAFAIPWYRELIASADAGQDRNADDYVQWLVNLADAFMDIGISDSARMFGEKALSLIGDNKTFYHVQFSVAAGVKAKWLSRNGKSTEAITILEEAREVLERAGKPTTTYSYNILIELAEQYRSQSRYDEAGKMNETAIGIIRELSGGQSLAYARALNNITSFYRDANQVQNALSANSKAIEILKSIHEDTGMDYARSMLNQAGLWQDLSEYEKGLTAIRTAIDIGERNAINQTPFLIAALNRQHVLYRRLNQFDSAETCLRRISVRVKLRYGSRSTEYINTRSDYAALLKARGLMAEANRIFLEVRDSIRILQGGDAMRYLLATRDAGRSFLDMVDYEKAEPLYREILAILGRTDQLKTFEAADAAYRLAQIHEQTKRPETAERFHHQALAICETITGRNDASYAFYLRELGLFHLRQGRDPAKAEQYLADAVGSLTGSANGAASGLHGRYLTDLATAKSERNKNKEAEDIFKTALEMLRADRKNKEVWLMEGLEQFVAFQEKLGRYREAEEGMLEMLALIDSIQGRKQAYHRQLNRLIGLYRVWKKYPEALERSKEVSMYVDQELAPTDDISQTLYNLNGLIHYDLGNFEKAAQHFRQYEESLKLLGREEVACENNFGLVLMAVNKLHEAEERFLKAAAILRSRSSAIDPISNIRSLDNLASLYQAQGRMAEAERQWNEVLRLSFQYLRDNFYFLSDEEKAQFWSSFQEEFEYYNSFAVARSQKNPAVAGTMYDNQLATKAILLSASNKVRNRILRSNDTLMIDNYYQWLETREILADYYSLSASEFKKQQRKVDSLQTRIKVLEKELSLTAEELSDERNNAQVSWRDVQKRLASDEAAVEIIRYRHFDRYLRDSVIYAALILTSEMRTHPTLVVLPNGKNMEGRNLRYYKNAVAAKVEDRLSYATYWAPIAKMLRGKSRIYLSVDGVYHQINLNTLLTPAGRHLLEDVNITLLANTRDLVNMRSKKYLNASRSAALFGFPSFQLGREASPTSGEKRRELNNTNPDYRNEISIAELPGTKLELEQVKRILETNHWNVSDYISSAASERTLKGLQFPGILHIATHGFFADDDQESAGLRLGGNFESTARNPLLRSGILLTGASDFIRYNYRHEGENGILTAYEASNLNLDNTELVVLSACETGQGEIRNGEGVYGLQRSFQTAGARTVIMSLWKVDDAATQELMTAFYRYWMSGVSKAEAFRKAQLMLKEKYPSPYYWGAFVMLGV